MENPIRKAVVPIAGLSSRFLPFSKFLSKEFWPLADRPMIEYVVNELIACGVSEIVIVSPPSKRKVVDYFKKEDKRLEKILAERKKGDLVNRLKEFHKLYKEINFSVAIEKNPLGDGHAVLQAKKYLGKEPFLVAFPDDIFLSQEPPASQLVEAYKTSRKSVISLVKVPQERLSFYGVVKVEKIANRIYKIKDVVEKPSLEKAPSQFAIAGRYLFTPEIFDYFPKAKLKSKNNHEIIIANALQAILKDGKTIYGYELKSDWLECGDVVSYLESNVKMILSHLQYGKELKEKLKGYL